MGAPFDDTTKQAFLDALAESGIVATACRAAGIKSRISITNWREKDEAFNTAYLEAMAEAADGLEAEARRRAVEGVVRVKMIGSGDNAQIIDEIQYSDSLLSQLLKAKKPDEFAERSKTELSNPDGTLKNENDTSAAVRIAALLEEARRRRDAASEEGDAESDPLFE